MDVPVASGKKSSMRSPDQPSKGNANNRLALRVLGNVQLRTNSNTNECADADAASWALACQQTSELQEIEAVAHALSVFSKSVWNACGFDSNNMTTRKCLYEKGRRRCRLRSPLLTKTQPKASPPVVQPDLVTDDEVNRRTGFPSRILLLRFIAIVCNGSTHTMTERTSSLTWFEEWFFYFEYVWGRTMARYRDGSAIYLLDSARLRIIFDAKLRMILTMRRSWPTYASMSEDSKVRNNKWDEQYSGLRVV
ncbi:MAG: hypothetical protein ACREOZ_05115, partial [Gloeomargaritales cyanobacterium]